MFKATAKDVKNKGKGFLKKMEGAVGTRIVFKESDIIAPALSPAVEAPATDSAPVVSDIVMTSAPAEVMKDVISTPTTQPTLHPVYPQIPNSQVPTPKHKSRQPVPAPSERTDLPANLFVTSAEFEPVYNPRGRNRDDDDLEEEDVPAQAMDVEEPQVEGGPESEEYTMWKLAESTYDSSPVLGDDLFGDIGLGSVIAWKVSYKSSTSGC